MLLTTLYIIIVLGKSWKANLLCFQLVFYTLFSLLFLLILLTFSIPESRYAIPVQVLQIDYNRALEGPPGSKNLLSPSLREYLSRVSELCQCYFGQYYKINKISFIKVLKSTVLVEHQTFHCIYAIWLAINLNLAQVVLFVLIAAENNPYDIEPDNIPDKINYLFLF